MSKNYSPAKKSEQRTAAGSPTNNADFFKLIQQFEAQIKLVLPKHLTPSRMTRIIVTEVRKTPLLASCDRTSFFGAIITCAQLGLEPGSGLGQAYLLPFWNSKANKYEVQLIIGYQGMLDLCERDGRITVEAHVVYEKDEFEFSLGSEASIKHKPYMGSEPGKLIASYCIARYKDGRMKFRVLPAHEIEAAKSFSKTSKFGPWVDHCAEMARKTAIRRLFKMLPKSPEMARVQELDDKLESGSQSQSLDQTLLEFKEDLSVDVEIGTPDVLPSEDEASTSSKTFNVHDALQVKEARLTMDNWKEGPVAKDTQEVVLDRLHGKPCSDLASVIAEFV